MTPDVRFSPIPKTLLTFINVSMVPVRTRRGETRYLCATWGGAIHLFDAEGHAQVIPYPEGGLGSYSFTPAVENGFAWAIHTGGIITRIDVDKGEYDFVQPIPLKVINWGAAITSDGFLVCESSGNPVQGEVMVYDTKKRCVANMFAPVSQHGNLYCHNPRAASDGCVVLPIGVPGAELIRLDPRTGMRQSFQPSAVKGGFSQSLTFLPDGRLAFPHNERIDTVSYPDCRDTEPLPYPDPRPAGWQTFRDYGDGRLFAYHTDGGPLYVIADNCRWRKYLEQFCPRLGNITSAMFCALPRRRLLGLSLFGQLVRYETDGSAKLITQLDNYGYQHVQYLQPTDGALVFTTTFINMSFQQVDTSSGKGRNIHPCQFHGGQVAGTAWHDGKLWLACYSGAEISVYDPKLGGEWPQNPRHVLDIGKEQMRPCGMVSDGHDIWTVTHAQYGKLGGALVRVDPRTETCKVWRNLVPDHNPSGLRVDKERRRVYVGTDINADCNSAPPAKKPAALIAFDMDREVPAWIVRPSPGAGKIIVLALPLPDFVLIATNDPGFPGALILLDAATGEIRRWFDPKLPKEWTTSWVFLVGGDGRLYTASSAGLFRYDLERGPGEAIIDGPVSIPAVRGRDLFFIRGHEIAVAKNVFDMP
ncbi:MAG: hypothetical protein PHW60_05865 [Kiritimatiellae bacterium]|nr:hypothetical protein [Kiritimatiellia bacterium]